MTELKFYICEHCGNLIELVKDGGVPMMCCGKKMTKLEPGAVDASEEKHVPILAEDGDTLRVDVGAVTHPMLPEHHIEWIVLLTDKGCYRKHLNAGDEPVALFKLSEDEKPLLAYEYCNLHGLWVGELPKICPIEPKPETKEANYTVCYCNKVTYLDIVKAVESCENLTDVLAVFEKVKATTKCSTGCGGCYDKVVAIISDTLMGH